MWQPIETAPKDGTQFLAYGKNDRTVSIAVVEWNKWARQGGGWSVFHDAEGYRWDGYVPTHWQPLPEPPTT